MPGTAGHFAFLNLVKIILTLNCLGDRLLLFPIGKKWFFVCILF